MTTSKDITQAYEYCTQLAASHYENFPVASWLLPKRLRLPVAAIYSFARLADDLADEGNATANERLQQLQLFRQGFLDHVVDHIAPAGREQNNWHWVWLALGDSLKKHQLQPQLFLDLLSAFEQDTQQKTYADFKQLQDYCRRSANPVGRLLLQLLNCENESLLAKSDAICTGLQLINFLQDIQQDYQENQRLYFPLDEMVAHDVAVKDISNAINNEKINALFHQQLERATRLLINGADLGKHIGGRMGLEISFMTASGLRVAKKLSQLGKNIYRRPRLNPLDALVILGKTCRLFFAFSHTSNKLPLASNTAQHSDKTHP